MKSSNMLRKYKTKIDAKNYSRPGQFFLGQKKNQANLQARSMGQDQAWVQSMPIYIYLYYFKLRHVSPRGLTRLHKYIYDSPSPTLRRVLYYSCLKIQPNVGRLSRVVKIVMFECHVRFNYSYTLVYFQKSPSFGLKFREKIARLALLRSILFFQNYQEIQVAFYFLNNKHFLFTLPQN